MPTLDSFKVGDEYRIRGHDQLKGRIDSIARETVNIHWYEGHGDPDHKVGYRFDESSFNGETPYFYNISKQKAPKIPHTKQFSLRSR